MPFERGGKRPQIRNLDEGRIPVEDERALDIAELGHRHQGCVPGASLLGLIRHSNGGTERVGEVGLHPFPTVPDHDDDVRCAGFESRPHRVVDEGAFPRGDGASWGRRSSCACPDRRRERWRRASASRPLLSLSRPRVKRSTGRAAAQGAVTVAGPPTDGPVTGCGYRYDRQIVRVRRHDGPSGAGEPWIAAATWCATGRPTGAYTTRVSFGASLSVWRALVDPLELPDRQIETLGDLLPGVAFLDRDRGALAILLTLEIREEVVTADRDAAHVRLAEVRDFRKVDPTWSTNTCKVIPSWRRAAGSSAFHRLTSSGVTRNARAISCKLSPATTR